jgi:NAD(P)-dependent dehydrogenase (short-subunit alcohol dehydrogenase family)
MSKTVIITGAAGNLGQAVVQKFLDLNLQVEGTVLPDENTDRLPRSPLLTIHPLDVTREESCRTFVEQTVSRRESIDVAVLLVGGFAMGGIYETSGEDLRGMFRLNFESAYFLAREIHRQMARQPDGGRIVLIGARPALDAAAGKSMTAYALSKGLLFHLAELLNAEGRKKNVVTSVIVPSVIDTPPNRKSMPDANFADWVRPEQIADIIHFITTEAGSVLREPVIKVYGNA